MNIEKRIRDWRSIYNNLHPSKSKPSAFSFGLIFLAFLVLGELNQSGIDSNISLNESVLQAKYLHFSKIISNSLTENNLLVFDKRVKFHRINQQVVDSRIMASNSGYAIKNESSQNMHTDVPNKGKNNWIEERGDMYTDPASISNLSTRLSKDGNKQIPIISNHSNDFISYELYTNPSFGLNTSLPGAMNDNTTGNNYKDGQTSQIKLFKSWEVEAGGAVLFNVTRFLRLKAGMQLNYSNYVMENNVDGISNETINSIATEMNQTTTNQLNGDNSMNQGHTINNRVYQISLPLGSEFKLAGDEQLEWYAGATLQPTMLLSDRFLQLQSTDSKEVYTAEMRKWNLNSTIETYLNYNLNKKTHLRFGPQIRYQMLPSIYSNAPNAERLYYVGLKFGIASGF